MINPSFRRIRRGMRRYDEYVLLHYPLLWRSRVHGILPLALLAALGLFALGYASPNSLAAPLVHPLIGIVLQEESYFLFFNLLGLPLVLYWAYRQARDHGPYRSLYEALVQLGWYGLTLFAIWSLTIPAYRLGTIYRTAHLLSPADTA